MVTKIDLHFIVNMCIFVDFVKFIENMYLFIFVK